MDRFHHRGFSACEGEGAAAGDSAARIVTCEARASSRSNLPAPALERFSPLDALAALTVHIPEKGQQIVRYCV